jgi:hypothetical protein
MFALAGAVLAVLVVVPVVQSSSMVVNLGDRLAQAGVRRGVGGVLRSARSVIQAWDGGRGVLPAGRRGAACGGLPVALPVAHGPRPGDVACARLLFSRRGFAAGHAPFYPASFATDRDQAVMLDRLSRESVPIVLVKSRNTTRSRARSRLADTSRRWLTRYASFRMTTCLIGVAFRNDLHPGEAGRSVGVRVRR